MGEDVSNKITNLISEAFSKASRLGTVIGYVSRRTFSSSSDSASKTYVEINPEVYYEHTHAFDVGNYLVAIDIRTLKAVGLRIASIRRFDIASDIQAPLSISLGVSPEGLLAPVVIEATTLLDEDGLPYMAPIEPQSPVVIPGDPALVMKITGLPGEGVIMGHLHTGSAPVAEGGIPVRLPLKEFFKHLLVIGTTGSGKTTFIKNTIWYLTTHYPEVLVLVVDAAGDYTQMVLPPVKEPADSRIYLGSSESVGGLRRVTVLLPILRTVNTFGDLVRAVRTYTEDRLASVARGYHKVDVSIATETMELAGLRVVKAFIDLGRYGNVEAYVVPTALSYPQVADHLDALPIFSRQAKIYLRHIVDYIEQEEGEISNFTMLSAAFIRRRREVEKTLKIHRSTLDNIERVLNFIASSDCVDVYIEGSNVGIAEPRILSEMFPSPIVLDLDYAISQGTHFLIANLVAYEVLRSLHEWKRSGEPSTKPTIVILDEAHRFFPSEGTSAEEVELLADFIARIARLGRSRGLGIVFSTHSPKDVHRIVIQLSNTKIVFRSEREYLEMLDIPQEYTRILELAPDRVALMKSHVVRSGYVLFKTAEPLLGHFDMATLLSLKKQLG